MGCVAVKKKMLHISPLVLLSKSSGLSGLFYVIRCIRTLNTAYAADTILLGEVKSVAYFITVNEKSQSNRDYSFTLPLYFLLPGDHITLKYFK